MPRPKKDGKYINYYIERELYEKLRDLAEERGQTMTTAIERILKDYFDQHGQRGFDYAYLYPGMNKVLQAAGRVIRTDEDRGVILLLDDRFFDRRYQETFPREWENQRSCSLGNMAEQIEEFWKKEKEEAQTVLRKE